MWYWFGWVAVALALVATMWFVGAVTHQDAQRLREARSRVAEATRQEEERLANIERRLSTLEKN